MIGEEETMIMKVILKPRGEKVRRSDEVKDGMKK